MLAFGLDLRRDDRDEKVVFTHNLTGFVVATFDNAINAEEAMQLATILSRCEKDKHYNLEPDDVVQYDEPLLFTAYATYGGTHYISTPNHEDDEGCYFVPDNYANETLPAGIVRELEELEDVEYFSQTQPED